MSTEHVQSLVRQALQLSSDERVELIKDLQDSLTAEASHSQVESREENQRTDYLALFGSGRGGFATAQEAEADEFIRRERDASDN
jgi:hypothetical protein